MKLVAILLIRVFLVNLTQIALVLAFAAVVIIKILMWSATNRTEFIVRNLMSGSISVLNFWYFGDLESS